MEVDLGFEPADAVAWQLNPSREFETEAEMTAYFETVVQRVAQIPGVEEVGLIDALPLGRNRTWGLHIPGVHQESDPAVYYFPHLVDAGYVPAMRIPLLEGRNISRDDTEEAPLVMLMNESGAERLFPGERAVGRRVNLGWVGEGEIVGVVRDVRHVSPEMGSGLQVYIPMGQAPDFGTLDMVVRSPLPPRQVTEAVAAVLKEIDPNMPTRETWTVQSTVDRAVSARRFTLGILGIPVFAGVYKALRKAQQGGTAEISDLFGEFGNLGKWFKLWLLLIVYCIVSGITFGLGALVGGFLLFFTLMLMLDKDMDAFEAAKASFD